MNVFRNVVARTAQTIFQFVSSAVFQISLSVVIFGACLGWVFFYYIDILIEWTRVFFQKHTDEMLSVIGFALISVWVVGFVAFSLWAVVTVCRVIWRAICQFIVRFAQFGRQIGAVTLRYAKFYFSILTSWFLVFIVAVNFSGKFLIDLFVLFFRKALPKIYKMRVLVFDAAKFLSELVGEFLSRMIRLKRSEKWSISAFEFSLNSISSNAISILSVSIGTVSKWSLSFLSSSIFSYSVLVAGVGGVVILVFSFLGFEHELPTDWRWRPIEDVTFSEVGGLGEKEDLTLGERFIDKNESDSAVEHSFEESVLIIQDNMNEIYFDDYIVWSFDSYDKFAYAELDGNALEDFTTLLSRKICSFGIVIAYWAASSDAERAYNERLAELRANYLSDILVELSQVCNGGDGPPVIFAATLGQSVSDFVDVNQRRVQLAGVVREKLVGIDFDSFFSFREISEKVSERTGLPAPEHFSLLNFCLVSGADVAEEMEISNVGTCSSSL